MNDMEQKKILDVCCGVKGMWFDKTDDRVLFLDRRKEIHFLEYPCGKFTEKINPDVIGDFTDINQPDNFFWHIVFDPPHKIQKSEKGHIVIKYGRLDDGWEEMIKKGFSECFRVLKPNGTLIFKWNECSVPIKKILSLTNEKPLYGHRSGKKMGTHWICFMKSEARMPSLFDKAAHVIQQIISEVTSY